MRSLWKMTMRKRKMVKETTRGRVKTRKKMNGNPTKPMTKMTTTNTSIPALSAHATYSQIAMSLIPHTIAPNMIQALKQTYPAGHGKLFNSAIERSAKDGNCERTNMTMWYSLRNILSCPKRHLLFSI
ncbi:hypothetical protein BLNAU_3531 [Blattamonas nauphoetae]|uniref:Uncharacterized protein n=1 Tax=Blattamonas nauphoetae TaxID=2049346 RepID=A0ABQ9YCG3_9EUKA|nr:hypothetical protein BLNAU_3531 [Blattamonas nauphoetae]